MEIIARRVVDRSKYPKRMIYINRNGDVCVADKPRPLSAEEKATRQEARKQKHKNYMDMKKQLRQAKFKAKRQAQASPSVENAQAFEKAKADYEEFKETS